MKPRRFRLRNGLIVEECHGAGGGPSITRNGYIDDYKVVDMPKPIPGVRIGSWVCLLLRPQGMPIGGMAGSGFDMIEEVEY